MSSAGSYRGQTESRMASGVLVFFALVSLALAPASTAADEMGWTAYAGRWGVEKDGETSELGFEFQRPFGAAGLDLVGGLAGTADEAIWAYVGASWSWQPNSKWRLRPGFAVSVFEDGDGKDLGGPIEFRSSLETTYRARQHLRVGLLVYHLSNAGIYDVNPGSNSVVFVVGFR